MKEFRDMIKENFVNFVSEFYLEDMFSNGAGQPIIYNINIKSRNWMNN